LKARIYFKNGITATIEVSGDDINDVIAYVKAKFPDECEVDVEQIE
jgi:hypothetical protein